MAVGQASPPRRTPTALDHASGQPTLDAGAELDSMTDEARGGPPRMLERFGRYLVLGMLGKGGMGVVLKGYDEELDRQVAIKVLHEHLGERHTTRLRREAQAMAQLSHPNVAQVYEVGELRGQTFVAMELCKGQTVEAWMSHEPRPSWEACVEVFLQLGAGLSAAHDKGLVHRDFKPSNAMVDEDGRARVLDFGLVRRGDDDAEAVPISEDGAPTQRRLEATQSPSLTKTGSILGTPAYMSLEQMGGRGADPRSDQFSFCVALYEAIYQQRPFEGSSLANLMLSMQRGAVRLPPKGSRVPVALRKILLRGLATEPEQRWPAMDVLLAELRGLVAPRGRRGAALAVAVAIAGVGGSWAFAQYVQIRERCTGATGKLAGIWDEGRKQGVEAAISGTALAYAPDTGARVESRLDRYAEAWADSYTAVCEATAVRGEQSAEVMDLRMECLDERRMALRAAVEILARADAEAVENAVELAADLPGLARCDDVEALRAEVAPPEDPEVAHEVEQLHEHLMILRTKRTAGRPVVGLLDELAPVFERVQALGYGPLTAEARIVRGDLFSDDGRYDQAEEDLLEAYSLSMRHRYDEGALLAAQRLTFVVGHGRRRHAEGRLWGRAAIGHAERSGDTLALAKSLANVGIVLDEQGEHAQAQATLERSLSLREEVLGPDHPEVASGATNLAAAFYGQRDYARAQRLWERALQIWEEALGPRHPNVGLVLSNLGVVHLGRGELERAELYLERALRLEEENLGSEHPDVARSLNNLGVLAQKRGDYAQAQRYHERAITLKEKALGPEHPDLISSLDGLGADLQQQGEYEQAQRVFERLLQIRERTFGSDHVEVALSVGALAELALARQDLESARTLAERLVGMVDDADVPPALQAEARFLLARALWSEPEARARARTLAERARETYAALGDAGQSELAAVERWLAEHPSPQPVDVPR